MVGDLVRGASRVNRVLVTDRPPRPWRNVADGTLIAPVGDGGVFDAALAREWAKAGHAAAQVAGSVDALDSATVRDVFDVAPTDDALAWIGVQREAVLADDWRWMLAWIPSALQGAVVDVDVRPDRLGAVEEAARCAGASMEGVSRRRFGSLRHSAAAFWLGEVLWKGLRAPRATCGSAEVLFYAETANHWRHCGPIARELASRGHTVAFIPAAIGAAEAFRPDAIGTVPSLDARALSPHRARGLVGAMVAGGRSPVRISGRLSEAAADALSLRAAYARLVYEKARCVGRGISTRACVFGDASAHRPAGLAAGLREAGVPTAAIQHGAVMDARRYAQATDVFLAWDAGSARRLDGEPTLARTIVVGLPGVEAEMGAVGTDPVGMPAVLIAPSDVSERLLGAWIEGACAIAAGNDGRAIRIRLHPRTPAGVRAAMAGRFPEVDGGSETLVQALARSAVVLHDGSSVGAEARLLGVPEADASATDARSVVETSLRQRRGSLAAAGAITGSIGRAADVIEAMMHG
jgi:hypothetical protein